MLSIKACGGILATLTYDDRTTRVPANEPSQIVYDSIEADPTLGCIIILCNIVQGVPLHLAASGWRGSGSGPRRGPWCV